MAKLNLANSIEIARRKINRTQISEAGVKTEVFVLRQVNLKSGVKFQFLWKRCGSSSYVVIFPKYKFANLEEAKARFEKFCDKRSSY